ncbi:MAG TPA: hypothetical protein DCM08_04250, partial [Microscillaceae bacterium]|nr:hypothetical protein [Microscillaceae bacterium]
MHQHNSLLSTKAHESRVAIERLYIEMRHVFNSGYYKPSGLSGKVIDESLLTLSPEIYGSIADSDKVELEGLVYVIDRLPRGIEKCRFIKITSDEGYEKSAFEAITPAKRLRACYMIDEETMLIEVTRGRSEIYDIVTHLTFLYNEAEKIKQHAFDKEGHKTREWEKLEYIILNGEQMDEQQQQIAFSYLSSILGRTFVETQKTFERLAENSEYNSGLFEIVFWLGRMAMEEEILHKDREISFSPVLRERIGRHIYGERWAWHIKKMLHEYGLLQRPLHIISANLHSVLNAVFAYPALRESLQEADGVIDIALELNKQEDPNFQNKIVRYAKQSGTFWLNETYGTNMGVQIFDTAQWQIGRA